MSGARSRSHTDEPVLITSAPRTSGSGYEQRRRKYAIMMAGRALAVVLAATTYRISLWLALAFVVAGAVLPWCAVLIANDRPPRSKQARVGTRVAPSTERALPPGRDEAGARARTVDG